MYPLPVRDAILMPSQKLDDSYSYKSITTEEAAEQGIYVKIYKGIEVPHPHLHPELAREADKSKAQRTPSKRKAANLLDDATPKRPVSALDDKAGIPRHIGGLLSAVVPDEPVSQPPSPSPVDDHGDAPSPQANEPAAAGRGRKRKLPARSPSADADESGAEEDEEMPPIPNGAAEPDEHGVRLINKRARINDMPNNRIMVPSLFEFQDHEIGFRDSTNDKSRGATKAKRRKFLNQPNSGSMFFDRNLCGYDATRYADGELDQDLVTRHNLHPKFGLFLDKSTNEAEPPKPYQTGWKPTVFVSDAGQVLHTSRSIRGAKAEEAYVKMTIKDMLKQHMVQEGIAEEELYDSETERLIKERDEKRLELERQEDEAQDEQDQQIGASNLALLLDAATTADSHELQKALPQSVSPALSRPSTMSRPYDAIRDVFGGSDMPPVASRTAPAVDNSGAAGLLLLADVALQEEHEAEVSSAQLPAFEDPRQIPIQMPEPVRPKQLRDPSTLEQPPLVDYPDPENPFIPRQLVSLERFMGRQSDFGVQPPQAYAERTVPQSPLARPESFGYRVPGMPYEQQQISQQRQAPQAVAGQPGPQHPSGPFDPYNYGESEMPYEQSQLRRPSELSQRSEEQYGPPRPNTEDVALLDSQSLLDPQLFRDGQSPGPSQLQAPTSEQSKPQGPQPGSVLQQPQNSFFQTALNSPSTPTPQDQAWASGYPDASQPHQQSGPPLAAPSYPPAPQDGSPGRTPFSNPSGADSQPLPRLRPLHRGSGPLMPPTATGPHIPQHITMMSGEPADPYPQPPTAGPPYPDQSYASNGYAPDHPIMSTEQGPRPGYMAQPMIHPSLQPPPGAYPSQQPYLPPGSMGLQGPNPNDYPLPGPPGHILQSPPPYGNSGPSPSPSRRSNSISSSSRNNKQYREIKPAPRQSEAWDGNGSELRTLQYNPFEGIRDYHATAPPPSHGPTQIRGWTHTTGTKKSRGKNSADSQIDPSLGREEKK